MKASPEERASYSSADLPKPKNLLAYHYRCLMKILFMLYIGTFSILVGIFAFPLIRIFVRERQKFQIASRRFVSMMLRHFFRLARLSGILRVRVDDKDFYRNLKSRVVVANHPSMLDSVLLLSLIPNASCIVRGNLVRTPLRGIVRTCYIPNTTDFDQILEQCKAMLDAGCNVVIFPEGTRTPRHGRLAYKRGAARIAHFARCAVQPVFVGGSDKMGLGKTDPLWSFNHSEPYLYSFRALPEIPAEEFGSVPAPAAARRITERIENSIRAAAEEEKANPSSLTLNNV